MAIDDTSATSTSVQQQVVMRRAGFALSGIVTLFLLMDAAIKLVPLQVVLDSLVELGFVGDGVVVARQLGVILLICTLLYVFPPTAVLGAILLTGYFGGAAATHLRLDSPLFTHQLFGIYLGVMMWGGLYLRDAQLRRLLPLRS